MSFDDVCRLLNLQLSTYQRRACRYLEQHGQRFCVDFGYSNAVDLATEHWRAQQRKAHKRYRGLAFH